MKFLAGNDALTVKFEGFEMFLGLKRKLVLPRNKITSLVWTPEFNYGDLLLRIGGTGAPRLLYAGLFRDLTARETIFLYLRHPRGLPTSRTLESTSVVVITMQDYRYAKVCLTCQPDIGASLVSWFKNTPVS